MTETHLKERLAADVDDVEAPSTSSTVPAPAALAGYGGSG